MSQAIDSQLSMITHGCCEVLVEHELRTKLQLNRPLRIKAGFDPTASDLHLGHTVLLIKLRQLQDFGHHILFLIGDFTALIGDPTGKNITRPTLTPEAIATNTKTYMAQVYKILDADKTEICYNSNWLATLSAQALLQLAAMSNVARMLERDDFSQRFKQQTPIAIHEFMYPLLQGYDSVALHADIELGGSDQKFNLLMGRELQKKHAQVPQIILLMPLLEGISGIQKMSKSLGNCIAINDSAQQMFGKIMSLKDDLMWHYWTLLSLQDASSIARYRYEVEQQSRNPRDIKILLAMELVSRYHGEAAATTALAEFEHVFKYKLAPQDLPIIKLQITSPSINIITLLKLANFTASGNEAVRLITQGGVKINDVQVIDKQYTVLAGSTIILAVGKKKFANLEIVHICNSA